MSNPVLVVMAAGMGSRYGGLKQMDSIGNNGEWIIDYSLYDAHRAGFEKVIFVVREDILADFKSTIGKRASSKLKLEYAVQSLSDLPENFELPENRTKPWGTAHAVYSARDLIKDSPFMAINADDYYGVNAFSEIYNFLSTKRPDCESYAMVGYRLCNTVTEHGHVSRGVCAKDNNDFLLEVVERVNIRCFDDAIKFSEDNGETWHELENNTPVSLNCWGFPAAVLDEMAVQFEDFLKNLREENENKAEFFLPSVVEKLITQNKAKVKVLESRDKWYGITYQEDKAEVASALDKMKTEGIYPFDLWK